MSTGMIRDFIYLDTERIKSYLAQFDKGVLSSRDVQHATNANASGSAEGNIVLAKVSSELSAGYSYVATSNYVAHDNIFELLIAQLQKHQKYTIFDIHKPWNELTFLDGQFVTMECKLKIMDYSFISAQISNILKLGKRVSKSSQSNKSASQATQNSKQIEAATSLMNDLASVVQHDAVMVKIYPYVRDGDEKSFMGHTTREFYRHNPGWLMSQYGLIIDANWKCLVMINEGKQYESSNQHVVNIPLDTTTNDLGSAMERLHDVFATLKNSLNNSKSKHVTILAIYRDI